MKRRTNIDLAAILGVTERQFYRRLAQGEAKAIALLKCESLVNTELGEDLASVRETLSYAADMLDRCDPVFAGEARQFLEELNLFLGDPVVEIWRFREGYRKGWIRPPTRARWQDDDSYEEELLEFEERKKRLLPWEPPGTVPQVTRDNDAFEGEDG